MVERDPSMMADEWFADGLRFTCTSCGNCCTGPQGYVWLNAEEGRRIAALLGIEEEVFRRRYARKVGSRWSLNEVHTEHGYDCVFLDRQSEPEKAVCSVYEARPAQCRSWPFWPENLLSRRHWLTTKRVTPCPGMDRGELIPAEEIHRRRDTVAPATEE
ncbi:MAG: YkgJ family cysteine cluster protein [Phycisphaerales bacterium]|nr:MAG: YkgJ family cysteine cluster protein [Phycisphaerales bacterium]